MSENGKWLTVEELSTYLKMSRTKLYNLAQKGEIPVSKVGSQWRFNCDEIDDWMKSLKSVPTQTKE